MTRPLAYDDIAAAGYTTRNSGLRSVVGPGGRLPSAQSGSNRGALSFVEYRAAVDIARPRILHLNWRVTTSGGLLETDGDAELTVTDMIEYNGALSAQVTGTAAPGAEVINDMGPIAIPKGATFRVWSRRSGPLVLYTSHGVLEPTLPYGYQVKFAADTSTLPLPAATGTTISAPSNGNMYAPYVLDESNVRAVVLLDDSHGAGQGDTPLLTGARGPYERFYAGRVPLMNLSTGGASAASYLTTGNFVRRSRLLGYATDICLGVAGNDLSNGRTAAQIVADLTTIRDTLLPAGIKVFTATELPKTNSTDSWATVANQTVQTSEPERRALNLWKRTSGFFDYWFEFEKVIGVASAGDIVWPAGTTTDGIHGNADSYGRVNLLRDDPFGGTYF